MRRIDFSALKAVPIGSVFRHYGIEVRRQGEFWVAGVCPLPTHTSKEPFTFKAHVSENWWTCFSESCRAALGKKGGDPIDFVALKEGLKPLDAARKLADLFMVSAGNRSNEKPLASNGTKPGDSSGVVIPPHNKPLGWKYQVEHQHPMIQARGISIETAKEWGVGYYEDKKQGTASMHQRIVFPLFEDGVHVGYVGRSTKHGQEPKWKVGKNVMRGAILYGIERCSPEKPVILAESFWAPLFFFERGQQCVALGSTNMTGEQEDQLEPYGTIILAMDDDEAGREASVKLAARLKGKHKVIRSFVRE